MKKEIAKKWIKALRSGKYKQGTHFLKQYDNENKPPKYCCLGVLCELYNESMKKNHKKTLTVKTCNNDILSDPENVYITFGGKDGDLPVVVRRWAGMKDSCGEFTYKVKINKATVENIDSLSVLNDDGKTFKTIANIIEKNIENL
jgi:hypothetical protein